MFIGRRSPWQRLRARMSSIYYDAGGIEGTAMLAGSGRSGTTLVGDVINHDNAYRVIFEPFYSRRMPVLGHWGLRQYLPPDNRDPAHLEPVRAILSGEVRNRWADQDNARLLPTRRLVKEIRGNLVLGWLRANFPGMPIAFLMRHPCAVALSVMKLGWRADLSHLLDQPELMEDHLAPFEAEMRAARDPFERIVFGWAAEHYVVLRQFAPGELHPLFYEAVCLDPEPEVRALLGYLGRPFDPGAVRVLAGASRTSTTGEAIADADAAAALVGAWRRRIEPGQLRRAIGILALFGLDRVYSDGVTPRIPGAEVLRLHD